MSTLELTLEQDQHIMPTLEPTLEQRRTYAYVRNDFRTTMNTEYLL
jgi:hypothetical protein